MKNFSAEKLLEIRLNHLTHTIVNNACSSFLRQLVDNFVETSEKNWGRGHDNEVISIIQRLNKLCKLLKKWWLKTDNETLKFMKKLQKTIFNKKKNLCQRRST